MKYTTEILVGLPRKQVIELFDNPGNMKHWQRGFIGIEHIDGTPGEEGARSRLTYKMGKRTVEMVETISVRELPDSFHASYEARGVFNVVRNYFREKDADTTLWVSENEFRFKGFMKVMALIMPGAFRKQSHKYMEDFKAFAERGISVEQI